MPLVAIQDGQVVLREGQVGLESECCCEEGDTCPDGCPELSACNLIVRILYDEPVDLEYGPASDFYDPISCSLSFEVADIPFESGGDISASFAVSYDENCNPVAALTQITHSDDCSDPAVTCVGVSVLFDCNPLP